MSSYKKAIELWKDTRKQRYLQSQFEYKYAFVGLGNHSIENLYPILSFLRVQLKYIVTRSWKNATAVTKEFPGVVGTCNFSEVLSDDEVKGVFICAQPESHFELLEQTLMSNKNVFIEKPPCQNFSELIKLINVRPSKQITCMVGLQKRYAPAYTVLKKKVRHVISYNYRFVTGKYPEGNSLYDLFIHPLSVVSFLFGDFELISFQRTRGGQTVFLHLKHLDDTIGSIELSSEYGWSMAHEELHINTKDGVYHTDNLHQVTFEKKSPTFLDLPWEKILATTPQQQFLFRQSPFIPVLQNNTHHIHGYVSEIQNFLSLCENKGGKNLSDLKSLVSIYRLFKILDN